MKTLYIECKMGIAGDMLSAALLDLLPEDKQIEAIKVLNSIGLDGVTFSVEKTSRCGIKGNSVKVTVNGIEEESIDFNPHKASEKTPEVNHEDQHQHHSYINIKNTISNLHLPDEVKENALAIYNLLAKSESNAHGVPVNEIHFHEVGNKDAIMDICAVCYLMTLTGAEKIIASPVNVGSGMVHCAHGILPVPAPATEFLLRGIPYYEGKIIAELCTPTGAALLKYFASDFIPMPVMKISSTGIGCGKKDFEVANCVRVFLGEVQENYSTDKIIELETNVDDMTAEEIGFAMNRLFDAGAREVFTTAINMKKNRPGTLITVICSEDKRSEIINTFFKHTTTIGIRQKNCQRYILDRKVTVEKTELGDVRKKSSQGYGCSKVKPEYDDLEKIALEKNMSLREVKKLLNF